MSYVLGIAMVVISVEIAIAIRLKRYLYGKK